MSNVAVIFAGGTGQRMNTRTRPKQFLELHGKPIIIYTLEAFEEHSEIDGIIVVMLESWIRYTQELIRKYNLKKDKESRSRRQLRPGIHLQRALRCRFRVL